MTEASSTAPGAAAPPDLARSTPGEYLRRLREEKGHTHAAVGSALHLTVHYIKALESDEYGKLPGLTFVKGYLRSYARFLGADVDNVLARFDEHITGLLDAGMHTARVERSRRRQDQALRWAIGAGLVVVVGLAAGWWFMRDTAPPAPVTAQQPVVPSADRAAPPARTVASGTLANAGAPVQAQANTAYLPAPAQSSLAPAGLVTAPADAAATSTAELAVALQATPALAADATTVQTGDGLAVPPSDAIQTTAASAAVGPRQVALVGAGNDELKLSLRGNSWIEVDDGNGVRLYNDMLSAGDSLTIRGVAPFHVLLGDAGRVDVSLNAAPVDISADIRGDSTARLVLGEEAGAGQPQVDPPAAGAASPVVQPASDEVTQ